MDRFDGVLCRPGKIKDKPDLIRMVSKSDSFENGVINCQL